jgi:hypothetical protein
MSRDLTGLYTLPSVINPVQPGTIIAVEWANPTLTDIAAAISDSLSRSGKGGMGAPLDMGGYRIVSIGLATAPTDAPQAAQVRDQNFSWLTTVVSDGAGNAYAGNAPLATAPINGTAFQFLADKDNTGAMTLAVNGAAALPIQIHGTATPPGLILAGAVVEVVYVNLTWRLVSVSSGGGTIAQVQSADPALVSVINDTGTGIATLTPHSNVAGGMVKLDGNIKVPIAQLPFTDLAFIGMWNAGPTLLPSAANNGEFYVISGAGNLVLFRISVGNTYTAQATALVVGDYIVYNTVGTASQPVGWYYSPVSLLPVTASNVAMTQSSANAPFAGITNAQAWMNVADPTILARLPLTGGTMSGPILSPAVPGGPTELANKGYVDGIAAGLVGVLSFNGRTGAVLLTPADISGALTYTPADAAGQVFTGAVQAPTIIATTYMQAKGFVAIPPATSPLTGVINFTDGQSQIRTVPGALTITAINNIPRGSLLRLTLEDTAAGALIWPASVAWPLGVLPTFTAGPLKKAIVVLEALDTTGGPNTLLASATVY